MGRGTGGCHPALPNLSIYYTALDGDYAIARQAGFQTNDSPSWQMRGSGWLVSKPAPKSALPQSAENQRAGTKVNVTSSNCKALIPSQIPMLVKPTG